MDHGCSQPLRRSFLEIAQHSVHATHVDSRMLFGNPVSPLPTPLILDEPSVLRGRE
jgi:hypothetical protein